MNFTLAAVGGFKKPRLFLWGAFCIALLWSVQIASADDFLWQPAPSNDGIWGNVDNWENAEAVFTGTGTTTVSFPPSQIIDRAIIGYSSTTNITLDTIYNIDSIGVGGSSGEPTITTDYLGTSETLALSGAGFIGNPYSITPITAGSVGLFGTGSLQLNNSASLGFVAIDNYATLVFTSSTTAGTGGINNYGMVSFEGNSSGDSAPILNRGTMQLLNNAILGPGNGVTVMDNAGTLNFYDFSNAYNRTINNEGGQFVNFHNRSSADGSNISDAGQVNFFDSSTARNAHITVSGTGAGLSFYNFSTAATSTLDNYANTTFNGRSTAGTATINNHGSSSTLTFNTFSTAGASTISNEGSLAFRDSSSAGSAIITNRGTIDFYDLSTAGSSTITQNGSNSVNFHGSSTAGGATINSLGSDSITFFDNTTAGTAILNNQGTGTLAFHNNSSAESAQISNQGSLYFMDHATAGQSAIENHAMLVFQDHASAGSSVITNKGTMYLENLATAVNASVSSSHSDSVVDISFSEGGTAIGELWGQGSVYLGSQTLTVGTLGTDSTFIGDIQDGGLNGGTGGALIKEGTGTFTLAGGNDYTGGTTVRAGTLEVDSSGNISDYSDLHMQGGAFHYYNPASSSGLGGQIFGQVGFESGASEVGTVLGTGSASAQSFLVIDQLNSRGAGATGNFTISNLSANGQTAIVIGTGTRSIVDGGGLNTSVEHAAGFLDAGLFVNGNSYAWYDPVGSSGPGVRAINYAGDSGAHTTGATSSISTSSGYQFVQTTGAVSAQQSGSFTTLELASADTFTLAGGTTLSLQSILGSANGTATITGGDAIQAAYSSTAGNELVVYTAKGNVLNIDTTVLADVLTKSGAGTLNLNGSFNGKMYLNEGGIGTSSVITGDVALNHSSLILGSGGRVNGNVNIGEGGSFSGSGTVNGKITVASGGSTYPGDPQITTAGSVEYQAGSTAQFSIETTSSSPHPPVAGVDYDQLQLTAGTPNELQIDAGTTTLQLNLSATSLAALQSNAQNNINDLYFVFNLGSGTSSGEFTQLTLTEGANTYTDTITGGMATFAGLGLQFNLSYTASQSGNSLTGGNDVGFSVVVAVPEPGTWALMIVGLGLMAALRSRFTGRARA